MRLVARVDAFRAVAAEEVLVELQAAEFLQHRHAHFLGAAGVNGTFVHHDIAALQHLAERLRGLHQRGEVRALVLVDGRGHRDDEEGALLQRGQVRRVFQLRGALQLCLRDFQRAVFAGLQFGNAPLVDVETDRGEILPEFHSQRETDIAETDDADTEGTLAGGFHSAKLCPMRQIESVKKASFPADIAACRTAFVRREPLREQALVEAN